MASSSNPEIHIRSIRQNIVAICPHFCRFHANFSCSMSPFEGKRSPGHGWDLLQWFTWARHNSMESWKWEQEPSLEITQWWFKMAKSLFHNISTQNRNLKYHFPISIFCGKLYPFAFLRLWIFLKMGKLKKHYIQTIKVLNSDFEWGLQTQFRGTQPFIERTQRSQRWFTMVDPPIKRDSNSVDDGELDAACPIS